MVVPQFSAPSLFSSGLLANGLEAELSSGLIDFTSPRLDNRSVRLRLKAFVTVAAVVAVSSASNDFARMMTSAAAMACCAKADYSCARWQPPDDCCRHMGHAMGPQVPGTAAKPLSPPAPTVSVVSVQAEPLGFLTSVRISVFTEFKRPHDPPHLHAFSLLI